MPSARRVKQRCFALLLACLWINVGFWLADVFRTASPYDALGILIVSASVALTGTAVCINGQRIARLEQACCSMTRLILEADEPDENRRRYLTAVR